MMIKFQTYNSNSSHTAFGKNHKIKIPMPVKAAALGLAITSCSNYDELENIDIFNQVDKKEFAKAFSLDIVDNIQKTSDDTYIADLGVYTEYQLGVKGDIQGKVYLKTDKNDSNHVSGRIKLHKIEAKMRHYEKPNKDGSTVQRGEIVHYKVPYEDFNFDAKLVKENDKNYKILLKVVDDDKKVSEHVIERGKNGILIDGHEPFQGAKESKKLSHLGFFLWGVFALGCWSAVGFAPMLVKED